MDKLIELKSKAYDLIVNIERAQAMLNQINREIAIEATKSAELSKEKLDAS